MALALAHSHHTHSIHAHTDIKLRVKQQQQQTYSLMRVDVVDVPSMGLLSLAHSLSQSSSDTPAYAVAAFAKDEIVLTVC